MIKELDECKEEDKKKDVSIDHFIKRDWYVFVFDDRDVRCYEKDWESKKKF